MKAWPSILILALGLNTLNCVMAADVASGTEPTHEGKPVSYWVAGLEPNRSISAQPKQAEAEEAIHAIGPDAIPFILRYQDPNRTQRLRLIRHACAIIAPEGDIKLIDALSDTDATVRETALEVLPKTASPAALDDVIKLLADPIRPVRNAAVLAMARLAPEREETIAALVESLHSAPASPAAGDPEFSRGDAALTLGTLGAKAKAAVPELTELLSDSQDEVREAAATALWKIERNAQVASVLVERLENAQDYQTCVRVMKVLAEMGPLAKSAVPVIRKKIEDPGFTFMPATLDWGKLGVDTLMKIDPVAASEAKKKLGTDRSNL